MVEPKCVGQIRCLKETLVNILGTQNILKLIIFPSRVVYLPMNCASVWRLRLRIPYFPIDLPSIREQGA